jgi:hypothetical protein
MIGRSQHHSVYAQPATASTERTARSTVQSGLLTSPKTTAISVPLATLSTTATEGAATPLGAKIRQRKAIDKGQHTT